MPQPIQKSSLHVLTGEIAGKVFDLREGQTILGRHVDCEVVLPSQTISRHHSRIVGHGDLFSVEDMSSLNGTFVNGQRVERPMVLKDGDSIQIHDILLRYRTSAGDGERRRGWMAFDEGDAISPAPRSTKIVTALDVWSGLEMRVEVNPQVKLRALLDLIRNLGTSLDIDVVLPKILDSLFRVFPQAERGYVMLAEGERGKLVTRAFKSRSDTGSSMTMSPMSTHLAARVMAEGQAVLSADPVGGRLPEIHQTVLDAQIRALMCAPLATAAAAPLGVIQLSTDDPKRQFVEQDLDVLTSIATLVAQLVEYARWHRRIRAEEAVRESEARFRTLSEAVPQLVWSARADGGMDYFNQRWHDHTGQERSSSWGLGWLDAVHSDDVQRTAEIWTSAVRKGERFQAEFRLRDAVGGYSWFLGLGLPLRDESGRIVRWFGTYTTIDDQKRAQESLQEADRRKDEFLAMLSHELRNPLAPIVGAIQLLKLGGPDAPELPWALDVMERQAQQMTRLVDDLLEVSRITRGKIKLAKETVELASIIERAVETSRPIIDSRRHELTISLPKKRLWLEADPVRLSQVLSNLLNNSAKYTEEGGRIDLFVEHAGTVVTIKVQDNGIGIPAEMLPHVFDLFTQVDRSLDRSQGGLGIGLTLVRRLVEMHDGTVRAESAGAGRGSLFSIRLPLLRAEGGKQTATKPIAPAGAGPSADGEQDSHRILVVDDNTDAASMLAMVLESMGHVVCTAHDGAEALRVAAEMRAQLVLLDIGLPRMDGYEVVRRLREQPETRGAVIVAVTGYGQEEDRRRSLAAGFDEHLTKPVGLGALGPLLSHPKLRQNRTR